MFLDIDMTINYNDEEYRLDMITNNNYKYFTSIEDDEKVIYTDAFNNVICDNAFAIDGLFGELENLYYGYPAPLYMSVDLAYNYGCLCEHNYFEN